jgi:hypothetical protein
MRCILFVAKGLRLAGFGVNPPSTWAPGAAVATD